MIGPLANAIGGTYFDENTYIDAFNRIAKMNHIKRSGDIVLIMKDNADIPQGESIDSQRYTTGYACKSWHGSLNKSDSFVPMILSYPSGNSFEIKSIIDTSSICKGMQCEGNWKATDIIKSLVETQN